MRTIYLRWARHLPARPTSWISPVSRRRRQHRPDRDAGFTMVELLVVLAILALIAAFVVPNVFNILGGAKQDAAKVQIERLGGVLDIYLLDIGSYPSTDQGLRALVEQPSEINRWNGPYIKSENALIDPWGNPYQYRSPGETEPYVIFSYGADGREGGEGDAADIGSR